MSETVKRKLLLRFALFTILGMLLATGVSALEIEKLVMPGKLVEGHAETEAECSACHVAFSREKQDTLCVECHEPVGDDRDAGRGFHGQNADAREAECSSCHTDHIGRDADIIQFDRDTFDHSFADFMLRGAHEDTACEDCHADETLFREAPSACIACHKEDDAHEGGLGDDCASCHVEKDWITVRFDHLAESGFEIRGAHIDTACLDCHVDFKFEGTADTCIGCHRSDDVHKGLLGEDCASCHSEERWSLSRFNHDTLTDFPLLGGHQKLECEACHTEPVDFSSPGTACIDCHADDDPHDGQLGNDCASCHNERDWLQTVNFDHDFTLFPLLGKHRDTACDDCHENGRYKDAPTACIDCHQGEDIHDGVLGNDCGSCHNPQGWEIWRFDHFITTGFLLDGAHEELICKDCHNAPVPAGMSTPSRCSDCHRQDDVHNGEFGSDCGRCHITSTFEEVGEMR